MTSTPSSPAEPGPLHLFEEDGELQLSIPQVERMPPFLMSVLSSTDLWMFIASNGGLTAGRISAEHSLFPYETSDRLYERPGLGGPITLVRLGEQLWCPFDPNATDAAIVRRLTKSEMGDRVVFEEVHQGLGLGFRYEWAPSEAFGWVRTARLWSTGPARVSVDLLDGLLDILPAGVPLSTQQRASNLVDAYRHSELHDIDCQLALYSMSSLLTDRAEPAEALRANAVWRTGLPGATQLSADTVARWRRREAIAPEHHLRGKKGAYIVHTSVTVEPDDPVEWSIVADVSIDAVGMAALRKVLAEDGLQQRLRRSILETHQGLAALCAGVDGRQRTADQIVAANHLSNALFNGFRGGVFVDEGRVPKSELLSFIRVRNRTVAEHHQDWLEGLRETTDIETLRSSAAQRGDADLSRLIDEMMPLAYGRRHGDPSRPWNRFSIRTKTPDGDRAIHYEGNWRDIFQNWEALAVGYPEYLPSMIAKFVNACTVDGFNPYRISREGIDWEIPDPDDPWSNIGYWGDHQIIYLLRLLEALHRYRPELLTEMLDSHRFSFGDVPYRICTYAEMLQNPRDTIVFDEAHEERVQARVAQVGQDGRLVWRGPDVALTHLWEKLLVPLLSKLSNLVVDGGIWMNTQRPEWNDANNALPGYGLSVVTLAHTLRYARFLARLADARSTEITTASLVRRWLDGVAQVLADLAAADDQPATPQVRREVMDKLGSTFAEYRAAAYQGWPTASVALSLDDLTTFLADASRVLERSFRSNLRNDGLFHSYNTMSFEADGVHIHRLSLMLEGQVAALDAQVLTPSEAADLIDAMYDSSLYRPDQHSFLLYPDKTLPDFEARNSLDRKTVAHIPAVSEWLHNKDGRILAADTDGTLHFHPDLKNAEVLDDRLTALEGEPDWTPISDDDRRQLHAVYEETFQHAEFTGRSASMYGYEGLGCVYWHMVAKLLLATQESYRRALDDGEDALRLAEAYDRIRSGFGFNKTPARYGAFPTDAYSHTPGHSGAQQPGMTGQVKEQVLTRFGELGVRIDDGRLTFEPTLLNRHELVTESTPWGWIDGRGDLRTESIPAEGLGFTLAGTAVIYRCLAEDATQERIEVLRSDGNRLEVAGVCLDAPLTRSLFARGPITRIDVWLRSDRFR